MSFELEMNGMVSIAAEKVSISVVSDLSPEVQCYSQMSHTPRKVATFGKRNNSIRRNSTAEVAKQGWMYKQASSGLKQWNKRWFVLADRCLFYYKDDKEDTVLGSLPLLSYRIRGVEPSENITRQFAFKVWLKEEEEEGEDTNLKGSFVFCMQVEHAGTRTYYFSTDSHAEQEEWIRAMSEATLVNNQPVNRANADNTAVLNNTMVTKASYSQTQQTTNTEQQTQNETDANLPLNSNINGIDSLGIPPSSNPCSDQEEKMNDGMQRKSSEDEGGRTSPLSTIPLNSSSKLPLSRNHSGYHHTEGNQESGVGISYDPRKQQENVVLRRGFVPRTAPERVAQRKSSMAQLQQWVNQRRGMASQEDISRPSSYYPVNQEVSADYNSYSGGHQFVNEYPLYLPGIRPDSICSMSAVGAHDRHWTIEQKRHSLRDGPHQLYGQQMPQDQQGSPYYGGMETSMRRLSIQPRSRSVPRSPSLSSGRPYSPAPRNYASPGRSPSSCFDQFSGKLREDAIYPPVYNLRRSFSSPKYHYPGDRKSLSQGLYYNSYPESPSVYSKMVPPFHDVYSRELHPTLKLNEIETSKLLGRLCEQNQILKDHEAVVHRLRIEKDSLEEALLATHQEMELYHNQPLIIQKLQFTKETQQNQLINIRGELSQASSALTTVCMEFEALEDEANAIHGDLWEQLNAGGQSALVQRHIQKEFWRVQDVLEGLHKNNSSRGINTAKHKVASGASGSFSTNSPASPLSSVSLTSPLSPYSPVPVYQASPTKQLVLEPKIGELNNISDDQEWVQNRQSTMDKVGIIPPRTKSPTDELQRSFAEVNSRLPNGISRERPKSAVFPVEMKLKMSVEEQNERLRRNQSSSVKDKRRSLNLSGGQSPATYKVVRRQLTAHEIDIKDLEKAVRGQGQESPEEEIARLRRLQMEPEHDHISKELMASDKVLIPERYLDMEDDTPLSPEEQKEKQKKLERIKTLIAKSNLQNMVPLLDGAVEGGAPASSQQQLQEQEKRIEISCALAAEASRRSRLLSAQCTSSSFISSTNLVSSPSSVDFPNSTHTMKV